MSPAQHAASIVIQNCVADLGIQTLSERDAGQIARRLGNGKGAVGDALDRLELLGLIGRSRMSWGVRLYRCALSSQASLSRPRFRKDLPLVNADSEEPFDEPVSLAETHTGRLLVIKSLGPARRKQTRPRNILHLS